MDQYHIRTQHGKIPVQVLAPEAFGGEHARCSLLYVAGVWSVSALAMVTNLTRACWRTVLGAGPLGKVLWEIGRDPEHVSSYLADGLSRFNRQAKYGAAGWRALDLFYNYHTKVAPQLRNDIEGRMTRHWIGKMENRQAVTNRLKITIDLLAAAFVEFSGEEEIRLLSIASGSAQAVVEAMKRCPHLKIRALLLDADASAIDEAKRLIREAGFEDRFTYHHGTTHDLEEAARSFHPHIVEMVGFLDYRPRTQAIALIERIRRLLPEKGLFITCNIRKNREKVFLDWILLWPMIYRSEAELANLLVSGGFSADKVRLVYEPFKIHGIAVCRK